MFFSLSGASLFFDACVCVRACASGVGVPSCVLMEFICLSSLCVVLLAHKAPPPPAPANAAGLVPGSPKAQPGAFLAGGAKP